MLTSDRAVIRQTTSSPDLDTVDEYQDILLAPPAVFTSGSFRSPLRPSNGNAVSGQPRKSQGKVLQPSTPKAQLPPLISSQSRVEETSSPKFSSVLSRALSPKKDIAIDSTPEQSPQASPTKEKRSFLSASCEDNVESSKLEARSSKVSGWFNGESNPVNLSLLPSPAKETADPLADMSPASRPQSPQKLQRSSTLNPLSKPAAPTASRFSFFSGKTSQTKAQASPIDTDDELLKLDTKTALQPNGPEDPFSPSSFRNLLQNADGLLSKMQSAYRERTSALKEMIVEKQAQSEELDEAETRAKHLKMQLDEMALKVAEQDNVIMNLVNELAQERQLRQEEEVARKRSVRLVESSEIHQVGRSGQSSFKSQSGRRVSKASTVSDSGFESDGESPTESLFSKCDIGSPTVSISTASCSTLPTTPNHLSIPTNTLNSLPALRHGLKQLVASNKHASSVPPNHSVPSSCANCNGIKASEAWDVVGILQEENRAWKDRVGQLETDLDGCLDVLNGLRL
ncbi:hypothetical protein MMC20_002793 [Loxospora ochrophaea]|nr:hypothetical protein [Loxospora ochrophaea]